MTGLTTILLRTSRPTRLGLVETSIINIGTRCRRMITETLKEILNGIIKWRVVVLGLLFNGEVKPMIDLRFKDHLWISKIKAHLVLLDSNINLLSILQTASKNSIVPLTFKKMLCQMMMTATSIGWLFNLRILEGLSPSQRLMSLRSPHSWDHLWNKLRSNLHPKVSRGPVVLQETLWPSRRKWCNSILIGISSRQSFPKFLSRLRQLPKLEEDNF